MDARTANEGDGWAGSGVNPWHVDSQTRSILFLTDESDKPARIGFRVTAGGVTYWLTHLKLNPHETRAIDLGQLRDAQAPDFQGNKIPSSATDGSVAWIRLDSVAVEGRLVVIKKQQGMASSYDCSSCSCPAGFQGLSVAPVTFGIMPAVYQDMGSTGTYRSCNGSSTYYYDLTTYSGWNSDNTPVIAMDGSVHYRADGMSPGTANVTGSYTDCSMYDTNPDFDCPCISTRTFSGVGGGNVGYGCNDNRDFIIQQYHDYTTSDTNPFYPGCTDFTNDASTTNFSFAELNKNQQYAWAILRGYFLTDLQATRNTYASAMNVDSGYREPAYNHNLVPAGARDSRHLHGDAADIASDQSTWFTLAHDANQNGACVEPYNYTGMDDYNHVHMDWRGTCPTGWTGF